VNYVSFSPNLGFYRRKLVTRKKFLLAPTLAPISFVAIPERTEELETVARNHTTRRTIGAEVERFTDGERERDVNIHCSSRSRLPAICITLCHYDTTSKLWLSVPINTALTDYKQFTTCPIKCAATIV